VQDQKSMIVEVVGLYSAQEGRCGQTCPLLTYPDPEHHLCANCATDCLTCDDGISIFNNLLFFSHLVYFLIIISRYLMYCMQRYITNSLSRELYW